MQGGSRIVLDTKGPVRVEKSFVLDAAEGQPARLVLDLTPVDRTSFLRNIALANRSAPSANAKPSEPPPKPDGDARPLVVLDPGHGGIDNGTKGAGGELEKDVVLAFTQTLREKLESGGKYRVAMTRTDDTFIPLGERVRFARTRNAALFISVHADALPRNEGQAEGATVYTLSENASDAEAARLAEAENKADVIAGVDLTTEPDDVANILVDLAQRETKTFSMPARPPAVARSATRVALVGNSRDCNRASRSGGATKITVSLIGDGWIFSGAVKVGGAIREGFIDPVLETSPVSADVRCSNADWRWSNALSFCSNCSWSSSCRLMMRSTCPRNSAMRSS